MARFCPKCGTALPDNAMFCAGCGAQFPNAPQQPPMQQQQPPMQQQQPPMQQQYQQPMQQQPYAPAPAPAPAAPPAKKKSKAVPIIIAVVLVVALIAGVGIAVNAKKKRTAEQQIAEGIGALFGEEGLGGLFGGATNPAGGNQQGNNPGGNDPGGSGGGEPGGYDPGQMESALSQFNSMYSTGWPENEYTKQVPKPKFETSVGVADEGSFGILTAATVDQLKDYVKDLQKAGYTKNPSTTDENFMGFAVYQYEASNGKGYAVEVVYTMGMSVITIKKG